MNRLIKFNLKHNHVWVDYDYNLGHTWGQGQSSPNGDFNFIHIAKNASSEIKRALVSWPQSNYRETELLTEHLVILRDPTDRWISGIAEFLVGDYSHMGNYNSDLSVTEIEDAMNTKIFQNLLFDFVIFDGHTVPQCCYINELNLNDITFFHFSDSVVPQILQYVNCPMTMSSKTNNSLTSVKKQVIIKKLKSLLANNPKLQHKIDVHYYADHQLLDNVTFYTK